MPVGRINRMFRSWFAAMLCINQQESEMSSMHPIFDDIVRSFMSTQAQAVRAFDPFVLLPFHIRGLRDDGTEVEQIVHAQSSCAAVQQAISEGLCSIVCRPAAK